MHIYDLYGNVTFVNRRSRQLAAQDVIHEALCTLDGERPFGTLLPDLFQQERGLLVKFSSQRFFHLRAIDVYSYSFSREVFLDLAFALFPYDLYNGEIDVFQLVQIAIRRIYFPIDQKP